MNSQDALLTLIAEAYQVVGILASNCDQFDNPKVQKCLDNLAAAKQIHKDVLPFYGNSNDYSNELSN